MVDRLTHHLDRVLLAATDRAHALLGLAAARIGIAVAQLSLFLVDYGRRRELFGPDAVYPRDQVSPEGGFNLFVSAGDGIVAFELLYHLGIVLCVAMILGIGGRAAMIGAWALCWSLWGLNPLLIDGGDNLSMIVMPLLAVSRCSERLSLRTSWSWSRRARRMNDHWATTLLSNAAAAGIALQICLVYLMSGLYKAQGDMWVDGTALYYIMRTPEYFHPALSPLVLDNDAAVVLGTYGGMLVLIAFPFLVIARSTRPWAVAVMITFHLAIALFMGLTSFALVMMACDTIFVSSHLERFIAWLRGRREDRGADAVDPDDAAVPDDTVPTLTERGA